MSESSSHFSISELKARAKKRRASMVGNHSATHQEADDWDLEFWQTAGAEARLSALVALHKEADIVRRARKVADGNG
jgi:hypothetical protein